MLATALLALLAAAGPCREHVELYDAAFWARELGRSERDVRANYRINLWERSSAGQSGIGVRGRKVGEMLVGTRAPILDRGPDDFKVRSPLDGSEGWVGEAQVKRTVWQDLKTGQGCKP